MSLSKEEFERSRTKVSVELNNDFGLRVSWNLPKRGQSDLEGMKGGKTDWWATCLEKGLFRGEQLL